MSTREIAESGSYTGRDFGGPGERGHRLGARRGGGLAGLGLGDDYAVVFFDALRVKIRNEGLVSNRAVYLGLGG
jgi:hypothetical protein